MKSIVKLPLFRIASVVASACALLTVSAHGQVRANSQEIHIYGGGLFGDKLIDGSLSGRTPKLKDNITFGARYGYNFTPDWGLELSLGHTITKAKDLPGEEIDFDVTTAEVAVIKHFAIKGSPRWVPYVTLGGGYAFANLDRPITGTLNGQNVSIDSKDGFTAVGGMGIKYFITDRIMVRSDARYRYIEKLTGTADNALNTVEATIGIGWTF